MTTGGWINLIFSVGAVTILLVWCLYRVLKAPPNDATLAHIEPVEDKDTERR